MSDEKTMVGSVTWGPTLATAAPGPQVLRSASVGDEPLLVENIADVDRDLAALLRNGGVQAFFDKWIAPITDDAERRRYVRYCSERIHSMLMGMLP